MITADALGLDVSRETCERLEIFHGLLTKWNPRINLVAKGTLPDAITRHFIDSAQLVSLCPTPPRNWTDLGSGGGFPGLVVAIILAEIAAETRVILIDSDIRKATFLRTVARETGVKTKVLSQRIEDAGEQDSGVVSARALAPLPNLLALAQPYLAPAGRGLFLKGENWGKELEDARRQWQFSCVPHTSKTNPSAVVLEIGDLVHV